MRNDSVRRGSRRKRARRNGRGTDASARTWLFETSHGGVKSVAYFVVPEREVEGLDVGVKGKALARSNNLTRIARLAGVRPLDEFFAMSPEEAADLIEVSGGQVPEDVLPGEEWFEAEEELATVRGLLAHVARYPGAVADEAWIVHDLRRFAKVLARLAARGVRWHLGIDA